MNLPLYARMRKPLHFALITVAVLVLTFLLSIAWAWFGLRAEKREWLQERALSMQNAAHQIRLGATLELDHIADLSPHDCQAEHLQQLRDGMMKTPLILDVLLRDIASGQACSVVRGLVPLNVAGTPLVVPGGYELFNVLLEQQNEQQIVIGLGKGTALVLIAEELLVDMQLGAQDPQVDRRLFVGPVLLAQSKEAGTPGMRDLVVRVNQPGRMSTMEVTLPFAELQRLFWPFWLSRWPQNLLLLVLAGLGLHRYGRRYFSMAHDLRAALVRREITVHYQPVVALASGQPASLEALVRWSRDDGCAVPPDVFVALAEANGMIGDLTRYVILQVLSDLPAIQHASPGLPVAVNLSPADLADPGFADWLLNVCDSAGISPALIRLEITERGAVPEGLAHQTMKRLHAMGFVLLIDDFGTGYSSLSYLGRLPVDLLKIDRSFVQSLGMADARRCVVPQIADMALTLDLQVVGEGVETPLQAQILADLGIAYVQGWLYSKALPLPDLQSWLRHMHGLSPSERQAFPPRYSGSLPLHRWRQYHDQAGAYCAL